MRRRAQPAEKRKGFLFLIAVFFTFRAASFFFAKAVFFFFFFRALALSPAVLGGGLAPARARARARHGCGSPPRSLPRVQPRRSGRRLIAALVRIYLYLYTTAHPRGREKRVVLFCRITRTSLAPAVLLHIEACDLHCVSGHRDSLLYMAAGGPCS